MIETDNERELGKSVRAPWHNDDDDDDICIEIYIDEGHMVEGQKWCDEKTKNKTKQKQK